MPPAKNRNTYPRQKDYTDPATGQTDWNAYETALKQRGFACFDCGMTIILADAYGPQLCYVCTLGKNNPEEWTSERRIRCPGCSALLDPKPILPIGETVPFGDQEICVQCTCCQTIFNFKAILKYEFISPVLLSYGKGKEREEEMEGTSETEEREETPAETQSEFSV